MNTVYEIWDYEGCSIKLAIARRYFESISSVIVYNNLLITIILICNTYLKICALERKNVWAWEIFVGKTVFCLFKEYILHSKYTHLYPSLFSLALT